MKDWMYDTLLDKRTPEQIAKRKANRKKKLAIEAIQCHMLSGNIKKAIDIAEAHGISPVEFGKIAARL